MKKLLFATVGAAALALAGCSNNNNQDSVENAELNQPAVEANDMSGEVMNDAAAGEAAALGTQQQQLEQENAAAPADANAAEPTTDEDEQNVSGM
jgi:heat shock protein HslJ